MCFKIITKGPGIEVERGVTAKESQSHLEETIDLHPLKHQSSPQNRDSSLQSAQGGESDWKAVDIANQAPPSPNINRKTGITRGC